ncbi:MAG TPA: fimbria/pilus outer membrane usher protein [Casimicrobiaceae bacterium]|nr:fimbria/pilus outer membrane usher protein [Casimicrobiaceae bacterium]
MAHPTRYRWRGILAAALVAVAITASADPVPTIVTITVNGQGRGDHFVLKDGDRWLIADTELRQLGLQEAVGDAATVDGRPYRVLSSLRKVTVAIDEAAGRIDLVADPAIFGQQRLDLTAAPRLMPTYDTSAFFNYQFNWADTEHQRSSYGVNTELAVRYGRWLFDNQTNYTNDASGSGFTRLGTNATYDWYEKLARFVVGDQAASTGDLGQSMQLGGVGFYRAYSMDPSLITSPTARFVGATPVAGEVEVYVDGIRVYSAPVKPGSFELDNITRYAGLRHVEVLVRDPQGQVIQRSSSTTYLSDRLLRGGLDEFSYAVGLVRPETGIGSDRYDGLGFVAAHRVGLSDALTLGAHADRTPDYATAGGDATMRLGDLGVLGVEAAAGRPQQTGHVAGAASVLYSYSADGFGVDLSYRHLQRGFLPTSTLLPQFVPLKDAGVQVSYGSPRYGTFTATATRSEFEDGSRQNAYTFRYNISPSVHWNIDATFGHVSGQGGAQSGVSAALSVNYFFDDRTTATARVQRTPGNGTEYDLEVARPAPIGPGFGYRVDAQHSGGATQVRPQVQLNTDKLEYTLGMSRLFGSDANVTSVEASVAGAFAYVGGVGKFTRPIYDSFAIIKTGDLEGVSVRQNSQDAGRSGRDGTLLATTVGSYVENRFTLDANTVPIDTIIGQNSVIVVPALRGGVLVDFALRPQRALSGVLMLRRGRDERPLGGIDAVLASGSSQLQLFTAADGAFYVEDAAPGSYRADIRTEGGSCHLTMDVAVNARMPLNVGKVYCEMRP